MSNVPEHTLLIEFNKKLKERKVESKPTFYQMTGNVLKQLPFSPGGKITVRIYADKSDLKSGAELAMTFQKISENRIYGIVSVGDRGLRGTIFEYQENGEARPLTDMEGPETVKTAAWELMKAVVSGLHVFYDLVREQEMFPFYVEATPKACKSPLKSKRQKALEDHNTIVYLGKPPTVSRVDSGEGKSLEFGYPRREFYKTLRAERFKNHPMYGVYKGVKVRQTWCGPKEYKVRDRIYKLYEHEAA